MTIRKQIGSRIKHLRKKRGFSTQDSLGRAAGLSEGAIGYIERGETAPSTDNLVPIADALECDVEDLFKLVKSKYSKPAHIQEIHARIIDSLDGLDEQQLLFFEDIAEAAQKRLFRANSNRRKK